MLTFWLLTSGATATIEDESDDVFLDRAAKRKRREKRDIETVKAFFAAYLEKDPHGPTSFRR